MYGASLELSDKEKVGMMPWTLDAPPGVDGTADATPDKMGYVACDPSPPPPQNCVTPERTHATRRTFA
jgi:hypothetical protein